MPELHYENDDDDDRPICSLLSVFQQLKKWKLNKNASTFQPFSNEPNQITSYVLRWLPFYLTVYKQEGNERQDT